VSARGKVAAEPDGESGAMPHSRFVSFAAAAVGLLAVLAFAGWISDHITLASLVPGAVPMNPATAGCFLLLGVMLWCRRSRRGHEAPVAAAGCLVIVVASSRLFAYFGGPDLGLDQILFADQLGTVPFAPNRVAPNTAASLLLCALGILGIDAETRRGHRPSQLLMLLVGLSSLLTITGYAFSAASLARITGAIPMAPSTAAAFALLVVGVIAARPGVGLMTTVSGASLASVVSRRLLLASIVVPWAIGWLCLQGASLGFYGLEYSVALFAVATMVALACVVLWNGEQLT
jgi:hypothetical protein